MTPAARRVVVVGGGVVGLALAGALQQIGAEVTVLERAPALRDGGGALMLWANGVRALDALGHRGGLDRCAVPLRRAELRNETGALLQQLAMRGDEGHSVVRRDDLLARLREGVRGDVVRVGCAVSSVCDGARGASVTLDTGETVEADLVVGADGLHSVVRAALWNDGAPVEVGQTVWVGLCDVGALAVEEGVTVGTLGVARRFWYTRVRGDRVYWYALASDEAGEGARSHTRARLAEALAAWHAPVADLVRATDDAAVTVTSLRDRPALARWSGLRCTLAGDAAHPMTPDLGQGACQGFEDAWMLAAALGRERTVADALAVYERARREHAARVASLSGVVARTSMPGSPLAARARDLALGVMPASQMRGWLRAVMNDGGAAG